MMKSTEKGFSLVGVMIAIGLVSIMGLFIASNNKLMQRTLKNYDVSTQLTEYNQKIMAILNHPASCNATVASATNTALFTTIFAAAVGSTHDPANFDFVKVEGDDVGGPSTVFSQLGDTINGKFTIVDMSIVKTSASVLDVSIIYEKLGNPLGPKMSVKNFSVLVSNQGGNWTCLGVADLANFEAKFSQLCGFLGGMVDGDGECVCADGNPMSGEEVISASGCADAFSLVDNEVDNAITNHSKVNSNETKVDNLISDFDSISCAADEYLAGYDVTSNGEVTPNCESISGGSSGGTSGGGGIDLSDVTNEIHSQLGSLDCSPGFIKQFQVVGGNLTVTCGAQGTTCAPCTSDTDCSPGLSCLANTSCGGPSPNVCRKQANLCEICTTHSDCAPGFACRTPHDAVNCIPGGPSYKFCSVLIGYPVVSNLDTDPIRSCICPIHP